MKHTEGKVEQGIGDDCTNMFVEKSDNKRIRVAVCSSLLLSIEENEANAERITALWNAADGMTTEEAEKYLRYGPVLLDMLSMACDDCHGGPDIDRCKSDCVFRTAYNLFKLNREG